MKKTLISLLCCLVISTMSWAQIVEGKCDKNIIWTFDGKTLSVKNISKKVEFAHMPDYDLKKNLAPWNKKKLSIHNVHIGTGIVSIGSCAFAGQDKLTGIIFENNSIETIGWGAFYNCSKLVHISIPPTVRKIATIAFANCHNLNSIKIPDQCHVENQAFLNCYGVRSIEVSPTASLGRYVFANEISKNNQIRHTLYNHELRRLPKQINESNCHTFGIHKDAVKRLRSSGENYNVDYDYITSDVDSLIPNNQYVNQDTYALIIGNENYRFVPEVPYAIHDARIFKEYCEKTLGIPNENIHIIEDATKQLILDDEIGWLNEIQDRQSKRLIVYYAGHGVPDIKKNNKAYILPVDVRGTKPQNGILLNDFYDQIGNLDFEQAAVFIDACFSGINRDNESVNEGMRAVEIAAEEGEITTGNIVVFSAAQGNETAQGLHEEGHGLFTYYLLKELQSTDGTRYISFGELADNIKKNVSQHALKLELRKPQTPSTNVSNNLDERWRYMSF